MLRQKTQQEDQKQIEITSDMTNQYKRMQEQLFNEINDLEKVVEEQKDTISKKEQSIEQQTREKDQAVLKKEEEATLLTRKIEEMSTEFSRMLKVNYISSKFLMIYIGNIRKNVKKDRISSMG